MLLNYLKLAFRSLLKSKLLSSIEIIGLAIGMSVGLILIVIIKGQFEYDSFHPFTDRTYRIVTDAKVNHRLRNYATTPLAVAPVLKEYQFVEDVVTIYPAIYSVVEIGNENFPIGGAFTDNSFFKVFNFPLEAGNLIDPLEKPFTVVLTKETAFRFFGQNDPVGQVLKIKELGEFTVTGVIQSTQQNSHIDYPLFASMATLQALEVTKKPDRSILNWEHYDKCYTYALLASEKSRESLEMALKEIEILASESLPWGKETELNFDYQRIDKINPSSRSLERGRGISSQFLYILSGIAVIVLVMSMINYFSLSVGRSFNRTKEVGIRKVIGGLRTQLFTQLMVETVAKSLIALILAFIFSFAFPLHSTLENLLVSTKIDIYLFSYFVLYAVVVGVIAGVVPSSVLSRVQPIQSLNKFANNSLIREISLGKPLIGVQFALSLVFIIVLMVMYNQSRFMQSSDYGFKKENIYSLNLMDANFKNLSNSVSQHTNVTSVFPTSHLMGVGRTANSCQARISELDQPIPLDYIAANHSVIPAMNIDLVAGNNFPSDELSAEQFIIINEIAVSKFGFQNPEQSIGKDIIINDSIKLEVIGVVKNFNYQSFKFPVDAMAFRVKPDEYNFLNIKVKSMNDEHFLSFVEKAWRDGGSNYPLDLKNYEDWFIERQSYRKDISMIASFSTMALLISCLGLFGVTLFNLQKRTKEIGIRKVFGSSELQVLHLLTVKFMRLVLLSSVVGACIGYFLAKVMVSEFTYKAPITVGLIAMGIFLVVTIAFVMVTIQTYFAASENPVKTLRVE